MALSATISSGQRGSRSPSRFSRSPSRGRYEQRVHRSRSFANSPSNSPDSRRQMDDLLNTMELPMPEYVAPAAPAPCPVNADAMALMRWQVDTVMWKNDHLQRENDRKGLVGEHQSAHHTLTTRSFVNKHAKAQKSSARQLGAIMEQGAAQQASQGNRMDALIAQQGMLIEQLMSKQTVKPEKRVSDARSAAIAETSNDVEAAFASFGFKEPAKVQVDYGLPHFATIETEGALQRLRCVAGNSTCNICLKDFCIFCRPTIVCACLFAHNRSYARHCKDGNTTHGAKFVEKQQLRVALRACGM